MPTYDYRCKKCGKNFEKFQSMTEALVKKCPQPKCRGTVERLIGSGAGFIFKGTGFYQTDYKKTSAPEKKAQPETKAGPEKKTESKPKEPAPKTEKKSDKKI